MRPLELLLLISNGLLLTLTLFGLSRKADSLTLIGGLSLLGAFGGLLALSVLLIPLHLLIEGGRWNMAPVYLLTLLWIGVLLLMRAPDAPDRAIPTLVALAGLIGVVGLIALILLPVPEIPEPSGAHQIGTQTFYLVDESRRGVYSADPDEVRTLPMQVWYPAEGSAEGEALPWVPDGPLFGREMMKWVGLPPFLMNHAGLIRTHSYADLPPADSSEPYPVIVYSHGWGGTRNINQDQIEELASQGYIVVALDHTYGALITTGADGQAIPYNPEALPEGIPGDEYDARAVILERVFADDLIFLLDELERINADESGTLLGRLDLDRIGFFGHSTGAGAVMTLCAADDRCKAAFGQDTWVVPLADDLIEAGISVPTFLMNSQTWGLDRNRPRLETFYGNLRGPRYWGVIEGTGHYDFVIIPTFSPLAKILGLSGSTPGDRVVAVNRAYLLAFFDTYLKGEESELLAGPSAEYPEVMRDEPEG